VFGAGGDLVHSAALDYSTLGFVENLIVLLIQVIDNTFMKNYLYYVYLKFFRL